MREGRSVGVASLLRAEQKARDFGQLILVSNRGPLEHKVLEGGRLTTRRGQGGLVTALEPLAGRSGALWIAAASSEGDRIAVETAGSREIPVTLPDGRCWLELVNLPKPVYHQHYNVFSNPLLWFLQHRLWGLLDRPNLEECLLRAWRDGYVPANRAFAEAVVAAAHDRPLPTIMLHDYHLYLAPGYIRAQLPRAIIHHFVHIPWPTPAAWQILPSAMSQAICAGLVASDVVGFQTHRHARNFLRSCRSFLKGARVDEEKGTVTWWEGHTAHVRVYPISVDVPGLRRLADSFEVQAYRKFLATRCAGQAAIVRVDRLDPSKNVVAGFRAYDLLLRRQPELAGRVRFLAFLVPSRTRIPEYQRYQQEVMRTVNEINARHGRDGWLPIDLFYEDNRLQALAGLQLYDVLLVNSVADGMNLVAKEGPVVNRREGVLVLSEEAGAHDQLAGGALSIAPTDVEATAEALSRALSMTSSERQRRGEVLRAQVEEQDLDHWVNSQLEDLHQLAAGHSQALKLANDWLVPRRKE